MFAVEANRLCVVAKHAERKTAGVGMILERIRGNGRDGSGRGRTLRSELVVSRCQEDVTWLRSLSTDFDSVFLYDK